MRTPAGLRDCWPRTGTIRKCVRFCRYVNGTFQPSVFEKPRPERANSAPFRIDHQRGIANDGERLEPVSVVLEVSGTTARRDGRGEIRPILQETASNGWRFDFSWPKTSLSHPNPSGHAAAHLPGSSFDPFPVQCFPAVNADQGLPSRDFLAHKSAARPSLGGAQLRFSDAGPDGRAGGRRRRPRPAGFGANRLGQNRRLWAGHREKSS
jgi:hypothetical protein